MECTRKLRDLLGRADNVFGNAADGTITEGEAIKALHSLAWEINHAILTVEEFVLHASTEISRIKQAGDALSYAAWQYSRSPDCTFHMLAEQANKWDEVSGSKPWHYVAAPMDHEPTSPVRSTEAGS